MYNQQRQLDFLDILEIMSFVIGLQNLQENMTQGDKQDMMNELSNKADLLLKEIHGHLQIQDNKIDEILSRLERIEKEN